MSAALSQEDPYPTPRRLTLKEAATKVGVSTATIRRRIKDGSLRAYQKIGRFGSQWMVTPTDLDSLTFAQEGEDPEAPPPLITFDQPLITPDRPLPNIEISGLSDLADENLNDTEEGEAPPPLITPDQPPPNAENSEVYTCEELSILPQPKMLEQQALHQAGYWKGRWDEAHDRILDLERQLQGLPLAQLTEQAQSSRLAEEKALSELTRLKAELGQLTHEKSELKEQLEQSQKEVLSLKKTWWQKLFSS